MECGAPFPSHCAYGKTQRAGTRAPTSTCTPRERVRIGEIWSDAAYKYSGSNLHMYAQGAHLDKNGWNVAYGGAPFSSHSAFGQTQCAGTQGRDEEEADVYSFKFDRLVIYNKARNPVM